MRELASLDARGIAERLRRIPQDAAGAAGMEPPKAFVFVQTVADAALNELAGSEKRT